MTWIYLTLFTLCWWTTQTDCSTPQPNVLSDGKRHSLFVWIHLKEGTDVGLVVRNMAKLQKYVEDTCPGDTCERVTSEEGLDDGIVAGVGFGYDLYSQATSNSRLRNFTMINRRGVLGELPATDGDILVHAKSNSYSRLFELSQVVQKNLPAESIQEYKDIYGFQYKDHRDLSGFIDGTENPPNASRFGIAIDPVTNGSYCMTQQWVHNMGFIHSQPVSTLEGFIGRTRAESEELSNKSVSSHVARMTSGPEEDASKPFEIYRQSMPYGTLGKEAGLFFIAFAASTANFDYMLSRMTGKTTDESDDIMRISRSVSGNYWYFPSIDELNRLQNAVPARGASFHPNRPSTTQQTRPMADHTTQPASSSFSINANTPITFMVICFSLMAFFGHRL